MSPCYCGHDCARCLTYLATLHDDDALRARAQAFYRTEFSVDLPLPAFHCRGGRSEEVFALCRDCPFAACCRERGLTHCADCPDHPCALLADYAQKYVNRCNQIASPA